GKAIMRRFIRLGDDVVGISREALDGDDLVHIVADCSDPHMAANAMARACALLPGGLDVVVPAAAVNRRSRVAQASDDDWRAPMAAGVDSTFYVCRAALQHLGAGGSIVAVSSIVGSIASPGIAGYAAANSAVDSLVRVLALECGGQGIRVNAVAPG